MLKSQAAMILVVMLALLFAPLAVFARQDVDKTTVSGYLHDLRGRVAPNTTITISPVAASIAVTTRTFPATSDSTGFITFQVIRGSQIAIKGTINGYVANQTAQIPADAVTIDITSLLAVPLNPFTFGNPMTTAGDIIVAATNGLPTRLAKGAANTVSGVDANGVVGYKPDPVGGGGISWPEITGKPSTFAPLAHASSHAAAGIDPLTLSQSQISGLASALAAKQDALDFTTENAANNGAASGYAPLDGNSLIPLVNLPTITNAKLQNSQVVIGSTAVNLGGTAATIAGLTLTQPVIGDFANASHNHQNAAGGGTLAEGALGLSDVTANNASTTRHGFLPKLPNDATKFLDGTGNFTQPRPYKSYLALLSQSGTSDPVATVLENTLGGTVVWTRLGSGSYVVTLSGAFVANKTVPMISSLDPGPDESFAQVGQILRVSNNTIEVFTQRIDVRGTTTSRLDDLLNQTVVEIRVYP